MKSFKNDLTHPTNHKRSVENVIFGKIYSMENKQPENVKNSKMKMWFKRVGIGGLLFFTLKGIAWLFVFYFGAELFQDCSGK